MKKLGLNLRDIIFGLGGAGILYHEVAVVDTAEPLLIFAAFFLLGLIPAARADEGLNVKEVLREWILKDSASSNDDKKSSSTKDSQ